MKSLLLTPTLSEKAFKLSEKMRTYIFVVPKSANAQTVAQAVTAQYGVNVEAVRVAARPSKAKRAYRGRGRFVDTKKSGEKRAYVVLKDGDKLPFFETDADKKKSSKNTKESK